MTNAGGAGVELGQRPRLMHTCSANAAGGETSRRHCGRLRETRWAGMRADADTCRSQSCFPEMNVIKWWWTSWQLLKLGSSCPNEWRDGAGTEADSGAGSGGSRHISLRFLSLSFPFCSGLSLSFHLSAGMRGSGGGAPPSSRLAQRRRGYQVLSYSI